MTWRERMRLGAAVAGFGIATRIGTVALLRVTRGIDDQGMIFAVLVVWAAAGLVATFVSWLAEHYPLGRTPFRAIARHVVILIALSFGQSTFTHLFGLAMWPGPLTWEMTTQFLVPLLIINFPTHAFTYLIVSGITWAVIQHREVLAEARERIRIDAEIASRTADALQRQLQPALIIEALERIVVVAVERIVEAERLLHRLSRHVRALLRASESGSDAATLPPPESTSSAAARNRLDRLLLFGVPSYLLFSVASDVYIQAPLREGEPNIFLLVRGYAILLWIVFAPLLAWAVTKLVALRLRWAIVSVAALIYLVAGLVVTGAFLLHGEPVSGTFIVTRIIPFLAMRNVMIAAGIAALTFAIAWSRKLVEVRIANARLADAITVAEAQTLESRLHPHFLFNALNSIVALLHERPKDAIAMTERLTQFVRLAVRTAGRQEWSLGEERAAIDDYLYIQTLRHGTRLRTRWEIAPRAADAKVPRLLLQPLVENAVKHGVSRLSEGASVVVSIVRKRQRLIVAVENDAPRAIKKVAFGHGLRYVASRLRSLYGANARLDISSDEARFVVSCRFPYQTARGEA
ncbi:MAG TPA: histidine kinase [Thermoanaerobaculia bacterium]|jgi:two-component system sensor histidine kinase AlgZ